MAEGPRIVRALVVLGLLAFLGWRGWQHRALFTGGPDHNSATITLTGTIELDRIALATPIGGRVIVLPVAEGAAIETGTLVLQLEDPLLASQRPVLVAQLEQARALEAEIARGARPEELEQARAGVAAAQSRLDLLRKGARPEEIAAAEAQTGVAEAAAADTRDAFTRASELYDRGVIPAREWESARLALEAAEERLRIAQEQAAIVREGPREEEIAAARSAVQQQQALVDLLLAGATAEAKARAAAGVETARAQLEALDVRLAELNLEAPAVGILDRLLVEIGELVLPNQTLATMRKAGSATVLAYLPEPDLARVRLGQSVSITLPGQAAISGTIRDIASEAEFTPRNIQTPDERATQVFAMEIALTDPPEYLRDGMTVTVTIDRQPAP